MTPEEIFERAEEIVAETRYRIQVAREARAAGFEAGQRSAFEAGRRSAFEEMAGAWARAAKTVTHPMEERRWGPGGRAHFADPRPGDFSGRNTETELEAGA